jgi:molybdopterin molybdotransferase
MIPYSEALRIIHEAITRRLPSETVPLVLSLGRVLAQPIVAAENLPAAANSAMDGYAVRAEDVVSASEETPVRLRVIGEASAGTLHDGAAMDTGEAVRIMTGGIVPDGADAVVEVESTSEENGCVMVRRAVRRGASVRPVGEDIRAGEEVLPAGRRIRPGDIGVLASLGITNVPVRVRPNVGILATGNEIVEPHRVPGPGQVRNSSAAALHACCTAAGAEPIELGIARDDKDELEEKLEIGLRYDILVTTGGVSAGNYDFVQHLFPAMGVEVLFHKVAIKPGKPILFGVYGDGDRRTLVFGLPGNPVSSLITFRQFVAPAIRHLLGETAAPLRIPAVAAESIATGDGKRHFVRGILKRDDDGALTVAKTGTQSSGALSSMSRANVIITVEEGVDRIEQGDQLDVELL